MRQRTTAELWAKVQGLEQGEPIDHFFERVVGLVVELLRCDAVALVREEQADDATVFTVPASSVYMPWVIGEWCFETDPVRRDDPIEVWNVNGGLPASLGPVGDRAAVLGFESLVVARLPTTLPTIADLIVLHRVAQECDGGELDRIVAIGQFIAVALEHREAVQLGVRRAEAMHHELEGRVLIEQAKGMVAARLSISVPAALGVLHSYAQRQRCSLFGAAEQIVAGRGTLGEIMEAF